MRAPSWQTAKPRCISIGRFAKFPHPFFAGKNWPAEELHPRTVFSPGQWPSRAPNSGRLGACRAPPARLVQYPLQAAPGGVTELPRDSEQSHRDELRRGAAQKDAPQFIARMLMVHAHFA